MQLPFDTNIFPYIEGVFIVGGSIRDLMCGRSPIDYDLVVQPDPAIFARHLAKRTSGHIVEMGKPGQKMHRVVTKDHIFDVLPVNGESIEEDLCERDFTINAMAVEVSSGKLIDHLGGRRDLSAKKIRMLNEDVFRKDPVRLIRAYRLAADFNFEVDAATQAAIANNAELIGKSAGERIREELYKILKNANSHDYLLQMAQSGLMFSVFPELRQLRDDCSSENDPNDLFEQTLHSYAHLEKLINPADSVNAMIDPLHFQTSDLTRATLLKWALLFHDIGKPKVKRKAGAGKSILFCGHAAKSAAMVNEIFQRLRFSRRNADTIEFIIRHHCWPFYLFKAEQKKVSIQKIFIRFFLRCRDLTPDVLVHALAQIRNSRSNRHSDLKQFSTFVQTLIQTYTKVLLPRATVPLLINGNDLITEFGLKPSPLFRRILKLVEEEQLAREALTRQQAIKLVEELLKQQK